MYKIANTCICFCKKKKSCRELLLSKCGIVWMDSVRYLRNNARRKILPQKQGKSSSNSSEGLGRRFNVTQWNKWTNKHTKPTKSFRSIRNIVFIPLEGCCWNASKPDAVPKEKVLKIRKPVSSRVLQGKVPSWTQGLSPAQGRKPLGCLSDILHRHEQLITKRLPPKPFLDHVSWLRGHCLPEEINEKLSICCLAVCRLSQCITKSWRNGGSSFLPQT